MHLRHPKHKSIHEKLTQTSYHKMQARLNEQQQQEDLQAKQQQQYTDKLANASQLQQGQHRQPHSDHKPHQSKNKVAHVIQKYERLWGRNRKNMIHYKYVARPVYKLLGGDKNPLLSVPGSFITMDYLFHQIPIHTIKELKHNPHHFSIKRCLEPNLAWTILWGNLALPIAAYKFSKLSYEDKNAIQKDDGERHTGEHHFFKKMMNKVADAIDAKLNKDDNESAAEVAQENENTNVMRMRM